MAEFKGKLGTAYVYQGNGHDWIVEFWSPGTRKRKGRHVKRVISNSAKHAAIVIAKQMTGLFKP